MLFRLLLLLNILGLSVGPDARDDDEELGGKGFANVVMVLTAVGVVVLIVLVVLGLMTLNGSFDLENFDPLT